MAESPRPVTVGLQKRERISKRETSFVGTRSAPSSPVAPDKNYSTSFVIFPHQYRPPNLDNVSSLYALLRLGGFCDHARRSTSRKGHGGDRLIAPSTLPSLSRSEQILPIWLQDDDSFFGVDLKTSTRFDRNVGITEFLKSNLGTEVAYPLVSCRQCGTVRGACSSLESSPIYRENDK